MKIKKMVDRTLAYYLILGVVNFIVCTSIMFVLFNLCGCSAHVAPVVNYALGSLIWYLSCRYLLFRENPLSWQGIVRFILEVVVCYVLTFYIVAPLVANWLLRYESVRELFAFGGWDKIEGNCEMTIGTIAYAVLNYFGQRYFVFSVRFEIHRRHREKRKKESN